MKEIKNVLITRLEVDEKSSILLDTIEDGDNWMDDVSRGDLFEMKIKSTSILFTVDRVTIDFTPSAGDIKRSIRLKSNGRSRSFNIKSLTKFLLSRDSRIINHIPIGCDEYWSFHKSLCSL